MHKYVYATIFISAALTSSIIAQTSGVSSIHGEVRDPQAASVPGARVSAFSRGTSNAVSTTTDAQGFYHISGLPPGNYLIEVSAPGFARFTGQPVHLDRGATASLDIPLQIETARQQVVVTASGTAETAGEVAKSVTLIDEEEIRQRDEPAIADVLRTVPGLRIQQLGGLGGFTSIKTRGLRNQDTAILFDGLRFRDITTPQGDASSFVQDFLDTSLDRIEVLRGSGSSLYGSNAIGGAINLIGSEGGGQTRGSVLLEGGSLGTFRGKAEIGGGMLDNRVQYSAGLTHLDVTSGIDGHNPARITSGQGRVGSEIAPGLRVIARMYGADSLSRQVGEPGAIGNLPPNGIVDAVSNLTFQPAPDDPDSSRSARFLAGALILQGTPTPRINYSATYQGVSTWSDFGNGPAGTGYQPVGGNTHSIAEGLDQIINAQGSIQWTQHSLLTGGYEFEDESYTSRSLQVADVGDSRADISEHSNAVFVQDQERFFENRLIVAGSFRTQLFGVNQPVFTPQQSAPYAGTTLSTPPNAYTGDGAVAWFFRKTGTKIRAHGSRGYRAPSIYERFGTYFDPIYGYSAYGDPRLTPEHSTSFDAGIDQEFWNNRVRASGTYFYTRLENTILFSENIDGATDPYGRYFGYANGKGGLARGFETSVTAAPSRSLHVTASYTYTNSQQNTPAVEDIVRSLNLPEHQFTIVATQWVGPRFYVNFDLSASSSYLAPVTSAETFQAYPFRFDGIHKGGLGASYRLPISEFRAVRFFGRITNLFNQSYYEAGFRTAGVGGSGGMQFEF
jgi:iron complex outermembrane receptor protein